MGKPYNLEYDIITKNTGKIKTIVSIAEIEKMGQKIPSKFQVLSMTSPSANKMRI
jgi:hypothetical protein